MKIHQFCHGIGGAVMVHTNPEFKNETLPSVIVTYRSDIPGPEKQLQFLGVSGLIYQTKPLNPAGGEKGMSLLSAAAKNIPSPGRSALG